MYKNIMIVLCVLSYFVPNSIYAQSRKQLVAEEKKVTISDKYPKMEGKMDEISEKIPLKTSSNPNNLKESADASLAWLGFLDEGDYGGSWDRASEIFRITVPKKDWVKLMERVRKPSGKSISREVVDQRIAIDPKGLPPGEYMVMIYNTSFSNKPSSIELVTLRKEMGNWKVLTYQVK